MTWTTIYLSLSRRSKFLRYWKTFICRSSCLGLVLCQAFQTCSITQHHLYYSSSHSHFAVSALESAIPAPLQVLIIVSLLVWVRRGSSSLTTGISISPWTVPLLVFDSVGLTLVWSSGQCSWRSGKHLSSQSTWMSSTLWLVHIHLHSGTGARAFPSDLLDWMKRMEHGYLYKYCCFCTL